MAHHGAEEVDDEAGGGDAERLQPEADEDPGGAGELECREDREEAERNADEGALLSC